MSNVEGSQIHQFELEITIAASKSRVWEALTEETNAWWLADFRALGEGSTVTFDAKPGGHLVENTPDGGGLVWYSVQMAQPGSALYLVGHTAPDWGGPTLSMLKLSLEATEDGCTLKVSDSLVGRVSEQQAKSLKSGWAQLFGEGLKAHAESE
jgi:uncharacterized protein YndB with AHSA1/START domain